MTMANAPLSGMGCDGYEVIWVSHEVEYFCDQIWTGQITLNAFDKSAFTRNAFSTKILVTEADECADPARRANHPALLCRHCEERARPP
jgi:hypothetical protein